jgi:hypothetical protein
MGKLFTDPPLQLAEWVPGKPTWSPRPDSGHRKAWLYSGSTFRMASNSSWVLNSSAFSTFRRSLVSTAVTSTPPILAPGTWEVPMTNIGRRYTPMTAI